jgi:hypothetical protein
MIQEACVGKAEMTAALICSGFNSVVSLIQDRRKEWSLIIQASNDVVSDISTNSGWSLPSNFWARRRPLCRQSKLWENFNAEGTYR